ncbi:site-specific integrase [Synechococcus sp. CCY 0621]|uniref:site-specific integrase n=1 Tax=Synechococcus sp. CCY 0621 TaxID=2815603 RepID=UPI001C22584B|nr:site-specific integrase [Synechococcus sp. CCY 0621]
MPTSRPSPAWVATLRDALRHEHGRGWSVAESRGQVRLTRRDLAGSRSTCTLPIAWERGCVSVVIATIASLRDRMEQQGLSLAAAAELLAAAPPTGPIDWPALVAEHLEARSDLRTTTYRDLETRLVRMQSTLTSRPVPRDGAELLRGYARQHFAACPPGGQGRKRQLLDVARFLRWAVERRGAPVCWLPPPTDHLAELIGARTSHGEPTMPISPEALAGLLDHLEATRPELWLAVALVGCYGLRPAELGVLHPRGGRLYVGAVKRNSRTAAAPKADRLVLPLELTDPSGAGRDDGARALALLEAGLVGLPLPIRNAAATGEHKAVGDAFRQLLDRLPYWQGLAERTPGLSPYGLRHGFAWRGAHRQPPIPLRDLAAVMGHSPATHLRHYGRWTAEADLLLSFATPPPAVGVDTAGRHV